MPEAGEDIPSLRQSLRIQRVLEDTYQRTRGELRNYTRTTAAKSQQALIKALDRAHIRVMSGACSYTEAVRETVLELAEHQAQVVYPTGHVDTLEVAVLRAVRTGTAQASGNMTMGLMEQYQWDIVLTSAHIGARYGDGGENPGNHSWWQGRFFSVSGKDERFPNFYDATGYGTGEGLCGWNCRHSFGPGDGEHNPWKHYDTEENKKAYDLSQAQRKQERDIRKQKRKVMALKEAIDNCNDPAMKRTLQDSYIAEYDKLGNMNARYNAFCDENGVPRLADRLQVAEWNYREAMKEYEADLTGAENGGTMLLDNSQNWYAITPDSIQSVPRFTEFSSPETNEAVYNGCVEVLTDMANQPIGTEEAVSLRISDLASEKNVGEPGEGSVEPPDMDEPYIAIHNHPSNETFSFNDVDVLGRRPNCMGIVVIGNDGHSAYSLIKDDSFDKDGFATYRALRFTGLLTFDSEDDFLKGAEAYGIRYTARTD